MWVENDKKNLFILPVYYHHHSVKFFFYFELAIGKCQLLTYYKSMHIFIYNLLNVRFKKDVFRMLFTYTLFSLIVFVYADKKLHRVKRIVGGNPADIPPEDDPAVYTNFAGKSALVRGVRDFPHYVFRGIYYADPPTGKDRFLVSRIVVS